MDKDKNIELRSDSVKEILGRVPNWIIRRGIGVFFSILVVLLVLSYFFKYPDIIHSRLTLTTINPPVDLVARTNGQIKTLSIVSNQMVQQNQLLAIIENTANSTDVALLKKELNQLAYNNISNVGFKPYKLGEIQPFYNGFVKAAADYNRFVTLDYYNQKIEALQQQINDYQLYIHKKGKQKSVLKKELSIDKNHLKRDSLLFVRGVISQSDYQKAKKRYLAQEYAYYGSGSDVVATQIDITKVKEQIIDLQLKNEDENKRLKNLYIDALNSLTAKIALWEQQYMLRSPISGKVVFNKFYSENQNVKTGEQVFTIVPADSTKIVARVELGIIGAGKVKVGQRVNIKLDNYPYLEYGMLEGNVASISKIPENGKYSVIVHLVNGLTTNYNKKLNFTQKAEGNAEIITEDLRLLERIFNPLRALFKERL